MSLRNPFIFSEGDTLSTWITNQSSSSDMIMNGFLTDKNVESVIHSFCEDNVNYSGGSWQGLFNYTVPNGKKLFIQGFYAKNPSNCDLEVDGNAFLDLDNGLELPSIPMQFSSGQVLSLSNPTGIIPEDIHFIGYLADENYFADCGGGGSSSSTVDSSYIDSLVQFYSGGNGGGCDFNYPDGLNGTPVIHDFIANGPYTVPAGKNFYTNIIFNNNSDDVLINSLKFHDSGTMNCSLNTILSEGDVISMTYNGGNTPPHKNMFGLLVDKKVQSLSYDFIANGPYTVPAGKELYIYRIYHGGQGGTSYPHGVEVNSLFLANYNQFTNGSNDVTFERHLVLKAGDDIDITDNGCPDFENMIGYLVDENYFAGCGGGGGSSSSTIDSSYIDSLVQFYSSGNGGGCDIDIIEYYPTIPWYGQYSYYVEASEDMFIVARFYSGTGGGAGLTVYNDTTSGNSVATYGNLSGNSGITTYATIPIKSGQFFRVLSYNGNGGCNLIVNYKIVCGNSSTTTIDSSYIDSLVQFYSSGNGGGCDYKFPEGLDGEGVIWDFNSSGDFTVPIGKNLYITHYHSAGYGELTIQGITMRAGETNNHTSNPQHYPTLTTPIIVGSGQIVSETGGTGIDSKFAGILVDATSLTPITHCISSNLCDNIQGSNFTVPPGKKLFINNHYSEAYMGEIIIDGILIKRGETNHELYYGLFNPILVNSGQVVSNTNAGKNSINGYLVDEDYFADCGGGGGSSSSTVSINNGTNVGEILFWDGNNWITLPPTSQNGATLTFCNGRPYWGVCYEIGDIGPGGGYVYYIDSLGGGLEVYPSNQWSYWGCHNNFLGTTDTIIGS